MPATSLNPNQGNHESVIRDATGRQIGLCIDPHGNCPNFGKTVPLWASMCRHCYDRNLHAARHSNDLETRRRTKGQVPITIPPYRGDAELKRSWFHLTQALHGCDATPEETTVVHKTLGHHFRPIRHLIADYAGILAHIDEIDGDTHQNNYTPPAHQTHQPPDPAASSDSTRPPDSPTDPPEPPRPTVRTAPAPKPPKQAQHPTEPAGEEEEEGHRPVAPINTRRKKNAE